MKTIRTLILTAALTLFSGNTFAQSWSPGRNSGRAPHENSAYFNGGKRFNTRNNSSRWGSNSRWRNNDFFYDTYCPITFEVGYVNKRFNTGNNYTGNLWGNALNGVQLGFAFQPTSNCGLGMRTGIFYEFYRSNGDNYSGYNYNHFTEHDFYIPVQLAYNLPVNNNIDVNFFTGLGVNLALTGVYRNWGTNGYSERQEYGNNYLPDRVNAMWEFGANVRYNHFQIAADYGIGLNDQELQEYNRTRQNKFTLSVGYVF